MKVHNDGLERSLRVAVFSDSLGPGWNGVTVAVLDLVAELVRTGHEVLLVAPKANLQHPAHGVTSIRLPSIRVPGIHPAIATGFGFGSCMKRLRATSVDVVHLHGAGPVCLLGAYLSGVNRVPLVITWHTDLDEYLPHYRYLRFAFRLWDAFVRVVCWKNSLPLSSNWSSCNKSRPLREGCGGIRALVSRAHVVIAPSEKIAGKLRRLHPTVKIRVIPTGVHVADLAGCMPDLQAERRSPDAPTFLYVGRVCPEKGIGLLLDAFEIARKAVPRATLILVGDTTMARALKPRLRAAHCKRDIIVVGEVHRSLLERYYRSADCFVFPSMTDTQGLVLQEAAYHGLPIIKVDGALDSFAGVDTSIVCEPTPPALAEAIVTMAEMCEDRDSLRKLTNAGRQVAAQLKVSVQVGKVIGAYGSAITEGFGGRS